MSHTPASKLETLEESLASLDASIERTIAESDAKSARIETLEAALRYIAEYSGDPAIENTANRALGATR